MIMSADHSVDTQFATELFIGGRWRPSSAGTLVNLNPATEEPLADIADGTAADVDDAVRAARGQLDGEWGSWSGIDRGKVLNRIADLIERDGDLLARLEALDIGKPVGQPTILDIPNAANTFRHFAGWADKITVRQFPPPVTSANPPTRTPSASRSASSGRSSPGTPR
ncbi:aldehyde dehydrogenase [Rhodococcus wratislaviensis]|uniref:Aldehyde dehydrogenase n=1 Tax=Rhodococcus wratislaviensis TaxID=44752 RepID=A0AB38F6C8_RHOWR|nr:aldehyde dehydrogenase [Rhodococcus wratislaviensis]